MITGTLTETNKAASFLQLNVSLDCLNLTKCLTREGQLITRLQHYGRESYGALDRTQSQWKARQWSGIPAKNACRREETNLSGNYQEGFAVFIKNLWLPK